MPLQYRSLAVRLLAGLLVLGMLAGCSSKQEGFGPDGKPEFSDPDYNRTPPAVLMPEYVGAVQEARDDGARSGLIDMSNTSKGYIGVQCNASAATVLRVESSQGDYNYRLTGGGQMDFIPLAMGNGFYTFRLLIQLGGNEYEEFLVAQSDVQLEDERLPFLVPSLLVNYDEGSQAVQFSYELAEHAMSDVEVVQQVYDWVARNISYNTEKAMELQNATEYTPNPDRLLIEKSGICYDYAALVAAMLRANAIPCQLVMGNVAGPNGETVYHAWNMIWLEEQGWVTVEIPTTPKEWQRIDLTFAAASSGAETQAFIGDGSNYMQTSVH